MLNFSHHNGRHRHANLYVKLSQTRTAPNNFPYSATNLTMTSKKVPNVSRRIKFRNHGKLKAKRDKEFLGTSGRRVGRAFIFFCPRTEGDDRVFFIFVLLFLFGLAPGHSKGRIRELFLFFSIFSFEINRAGCFWIVFLLDTV